MTQDLPFDGDPSGEFFTSPATGLKIWHCVWPAISASVETRPGVWILLHGLRGYSRYSWLLKEPRLVDGLSVVTMKDVLPELPIKLLEKATEVDRDTQPFYEGSWIHGLNHLGFTVHAMDLQGHGLSEGRRCVIDNLENFVTDIRYYIWNVVAAQYGSDIPLYAIGVSLGGNLLMRCLQQETPRKLAAAIILGGMCTTPNDGDALFPKIGAAINRVIISRIAPNLPVSPMGDAVTEANVGFLENCPHVFTRPLTAQTVQSLIEIATSLRENPVGKEWCTDRLFILHNAEDPTCPIGGCIQFWNRLSQANPVEDITFAILNESSLSTAIAETVSQGVRRRQLRDLKGPLNLRHALMCDIDHAYVFKLLLDFTRRDTSAAISDTGQASHAWSAPIVY
eukprot:Gregarina_sp_Poly_1__10878@NODE_847_length_5991_cov_96_588623_g612_i0_p2_GENE_NODE_847_length_5991_cov_96_588623_g612_i0NODE_847_length_5991_cov_96_588623_g612_i0_p2_ORF_typecomplete_len395_score38_39Hydrolase_4/PF12146_8/2_1e25Abhydrolase_1/PF00561_20/4_3e09Abhydrolase_6/PF12697_7/4_6e07Peptidase_S9/PF00326_21/0_042Peptidase_S9/PF00326_21/0_42DLH/PF01738_18/0_0042DUF1100/PF06500_11/2_9e03DUF1100/PF06500_11/0_0011Ser_hydrolase/PF06821_13/7_4e03Ser_hydrolase/PF06821_13/0_0031Ser_hydrolase/PF06821